MSCAACSARVEKAVGAVDGVTSVSVSLLTNSMGVEGTAGDTDIIAAVEKAGYGASVKGAAKAAAESDALTDRETPALMRRLLWSVGFLIVLMYISMGHMMWGWYLPDFLAHNHVAVGLIQLLLTVIIMVINQKFFISGFKSLLRGAPNMDTLVALGAGAAFIYSTYALFMMTDAQMRGDMEGVMSCMHEFYFESAAIILTLITVGKTLEAKSKGRTTDALKGLMSLAPKTAVIMKDNAETEVPIGEVKKGDIFLVRPGENIPVDGTVIEGESAVNEAALTGESIPADKTVGSRVSAATTNISGFLRCKATDVGEDTTLSKIIKLVESAAATKAPIAKVADKVSGIFVPTVIAIAVITTVIWLLVGQTVGFALARGISVLVISCPCALGLATPVAIMVANGIGARNGILFKTSASLEETGRLSTIVLDKTGTITLGEPKVTDIIPCSGVTPDELLRLAYSLEILSEHPLSKAITSECDSRGITAEAASGFKAITGSGLVGTLGGETLRGGNRDYIGETVEIPSGIRAEADEAAKQGKTPLFFSRGNTLVGMIAAADTIKKDSPRAIKELRDMGLKVVMLTGDNQRTAETIGAKAGVDEVIAEVMPSGKESVIRELIKNGKVAMVGDGINDAPALTRANVGIAIGAGTDIAIDAADVVLMNSRLSDVPAAVRLGRAALTNIHENLFWAFIYNIIGIPLAAGIFISVLGWKLNPMFGAAAMSLSSFCVVTNALRLNLVNIRDPKKYRKNKYNKIKTHNKKEKKAMTKTIKIEGMMCGHCEGRVKQALEAINGVDSADVSHEKGTAVVTLSAEISDDVLKNAVTEQGYKVL